jgi:LacI family transcriptional regulator
MPIRLVDVAAHAGVSAVTASHVLGGKRASRYNAETRQAVEESARVLGYRPNSTARAMRSGNSGAVTLLLPTNANVSFLPANLLKGIHDTLAEQGRHLIIAQYPDEKLVEADFVPRVLKECMADGLIVNYIDEIPTTFAEALARPDAPPAVWLNVDRPFDCIRPDDERGGYEATRLLLQHQHTRIVYLGVKTGHYSVTARQSGYERAMREAGFTPQAIIYDRPEDIVLSAPLLWENAKQDKKKDRITGVIAYESAVAIPLLITLARRGIDIPNEVSLITFYESPLEWPIGLPITTHMLPVYHMGQQAAEMVSQKLQSDNTPVPTVLVPLNIYPGATVVPRMK